MGHAPSLLQILPWLLNALRTKPKLPKWPTKSSAIEFTQNFPLDLLHYISRSSHSHNRLLLIAACAQTTAPRPPQTSCLQVSAPTAPAPPRMLPDRCLAWVPSAPFPEHLLSPPGSPTNRGFLRAEADTAASDAPRVRAALGLSAYLLLCDHRHLTCTVSRSSTFAHRPHA